MKLVYNDTLFAEPIANKLASTEWQITKVGDIGASIVSGTADVAISDPLDYARSIGATDVSLVPEFGLLSQGLTGIVRVAFRPGGESLDSLAYHPANRTMAWFASVVLTEKHGITPDLVEVDESADLPVMLDAAEAALLVGSDSVAALATHPSALDVSDEWFDLTDQPLPYLVAWGRHGSISSQACEQLLSAAASSMLDMPDRIAQDPLAEGLRYVYERYLMGDIEVGLPRDRTEQILLPAFHYAFYHTFVEDIPSIKYADQAENEESRGDNS
jgi:predicted solute-binding protein